MTLKFNATLLCLGLSSALLAGIASSAAASDILIPGAPKPARLFRVVVDPGHGGNDHGTVADSGRHRVAEKDVTLALAKEVARVLRARNYPVSLTRERDKEVNLTSRTGLANRIGADVFLSIHMNSTQTPMVSDAEGIETYILNTTSDASSRRLARLENGVLGGQEVQAEGMDVALILKDLRLDGNLGESKRLACAIQEKLLQATQGLSPKPVRRAGLRQPRARDRDRGVRQALFHVLLGADMPSVLVEAGFLTSPRDRALVTSPRGRTSLARAIADAMDRFRLQKGSLQAERELARCHVR
jgi:N-acetylmuramoyl-L-alanine amidase